MPRKHARPAAKKARARLLAKQEARSRRKVHPTIPLSPHLMHLLMGVPVMRAPRRAIHVEAI